MFCLIIFLSSTIKLNSFLIDSSSSLLYFSDYSCSFRARSSYQSSRTPKRSWILRIFSSVCLISQPKQMRIPNFLANYSQLIDFYLYESYRSRWMSSFSLFESTSSTYFRYRSRFVTGSTGKRGRDDPRPRQFTLSFSIARESERDQFSCLSRIFSNFIIVCYNFKLYNLQIPIIPITKKANQKNI